MSTDAFVYQIDPNRELSLKRSDFPIRVMRETARIHKDQDKKSLMWDIAENWDDDAWKDDIRDDPAFRAHFWFSWAVHNQAFSRTDFDRYLQGCHT
jgi:hypothetical protein